MDKIKKMLKVFQKFSAPIFTEFKKQFSNAQSPTPAPAPLSDRT
ncbi:hypothetical protein XfCFBP8356_003220 [Xylella fastidiosa subsp. sandyi]|nr:hypothetical protein [Xylella fastidiosa]